MMMPHYSCYLNKGNDVKVGLRFAFIVEFELVIC